MALSGLYFFSLHVVVLHQLATLKRACCGFFLKEQHVAANSALERLWELLSAGTAAAAGKAQTGRGAVGTQPGLAGGDASPAEWQDPSFPLHSHTHLVVARRCKPLPWEIRPLAALAWSCSRPCKSSKVHTMGCCQRNENLFQVNTFSLPRLAKAALS